MIDPNTRIAKLKKEIATGQVVIVTGTGVSVAASGNQEIEGHKIATWRGLLEHGAQHAREIGTADDEDLDLLLHQIQSGKASWMVNAAEMITAKLRERSDGTFRSWLKETIGQLTIQDRSILDAIGALPGVLATLNYDTLLEKATGRQPITWQEADAVQDTLRDRQVGVLHLHGHFNNPDSVVLGVSAYNSVKGDPHAESVLRLLTIDRTLLFVGCGDTLQDPNFSQLITWGKQALKDVAPRHVLLCRASEVEAFQTKLKDAPWLQPLAYGEAYGDLAPFLGRLAPSPSDRAAQASRPASALSGLDLQRYRQAIIKQYGRLKLEELDATSSDLRPVKATGLFIEQTARECVEFLPRALELPKELQRRLRREEALEGREMGEEELESLRRSYLDQSPRPIAEVVADPALRKLVVLGDPGSGKSLLLQVLALRWAEQAPDGGETPLPLLIELRDYARLRHEGRATGFLDYLANAESLRWRFEREPLEQWLRQKPSRVLFDGLDEVFDPDLRREVATAIHRFADDHPAAQVVVSSRVIGFQHVSWQEEGFRTFMLQELDEEQIKTFLRRWHQNAYDDEAKGERKREQLEEAMAHSPAIHQLAGNPLLLTLMAILNRTQELPRDRWELYNQCARLLLHQWKTDEAFATDPVLKQACLDYKDKRELLMEVAWSLQASAKGLAGNLIAEKDLERTLCEGLRSYPDIRPDRAARALIQQLRGRNFMLCAVGSGNYGFVHRTFLEFFCAAAIVDRFESKQTLDLESLKGQFFCHWPDEIWHEVLTLVAGAIEPRFLQDILRWLLDQPEGDLHGEATFLAARCVGQVRRRQALQGADGAVQEKLKDLIDYGDYYASNDNQESWPESELEMHQHESRREMMCLRAVQELARGFKDDEGILSLLKDYASSSISWGACYGAMEEIARGWKDDPDTLPWFKSRIQSDVDPEVRRLALGVLARGWSDDPSTLAILKSCAHSDADHHMRTIAVEELARGYKSDPDTLPWLKFLAQSAEHWDVRERAVVMLARLWAHEPDTLAILKSCAWSDHPFMRRSAMKELAYAYKDDPDTLSILKAHAQCDDDGSVRLSAMKELAYAFKDDPDTLSFLKSCAHSDAEFAMRRTAVDVRTMAILALARSFKDDPDTLPWLKSLAQSDDDSGLRQSAVQALAREWRDDPDTQMFVRSLQPPADGNPQEP